MKMEEAIQNSPSSLDNNSDPFDIHRDPLREATDKFGIREVEQRSENFTEEYIMELVREEINGIKIDLGNPATAVDEIVEHLEKEGVKISEDVKKYTTFAVSEKTNFLRDLERLGINRDNPNEEEKESLKEMALKDAEWIGYVVEYIRENRNNPEEIEKFWEEYDKTFLSFKEHEKNQGFSKRYNIKEGPEVNKRGILAEIAAMDLLKELVKSFEGCEKVEIEYSTPEQDVYDKIDFFLIITLENGKIVKIPVQVKSCDISGFIGHSSNIKELERKIQFVLDNVINTDETKNIPVNPEYKYQTRTTKRMGEFFGIEKGKDRINKKGVFVIIPSGDMNRKFLDPQDKNGKTIESCVDERGVPSEALRNHFLFESQTFKNVEKILEI